MHDISFYSLFSLLSLDAEKKLDEINQLKVKAVVVGPLHTVQADMLETLDLKEVDPTHGTKQALVAVMEKAHKKGMSYHTTFFLFFNESAMLAHSQSHMLCLLDFVRIWTDQFQVL